MLSIAPPGAQTQSMIWFRAAQLTAFTSQGAVRSSSCLDKPRIRRNKTLGAIASSHLTARNASRYRKKKKTHLIGSLLRRRSRGLSIHRVARRQRRPSMLPVTRPVRTRLSVHVTTWMRVAVRHVWVRGILGVLPIGVSWTRRRDGRIYRYIVVRIDRVGLMASPILLGH